jgi:ribonuclease I
MLGHLAPFVLLGQTPPGTCPECATKHDPEQPHNQQSLTYQYNFYDAHGRWPTWEDAMAHCSDKVKTVWIAALAEHGITVERR